MKILYVRIGRMNSYNGMLNDVLKGGGSYNKDNVGHEIYNFASYDGNYYGYVQPPRGGSINIDRIDANNNSEYVDDVLIVHIATREKYGQVIVGWYKNARVYKWHQKTPFSVLNKREYKFDDYHLFSKEATLILPTEDRKFRITKEDGIGQANVWYGNDKINEEVINYIKKYDSDKQTEIEMIEEGLELLKGLEKEVVAKARINQGKFREIMLKKYRNCCLCGIDNPDLLIASHIKPWNESNEIEKLSEYNGLLLCSMHDKLFDKGYISFNDDGTILVSEELSNINRIFSNIDENRIIEITNDNIPFIKYHRENIFKEK